MNKVELIGRLTRDPEAKTTQQGTPVTRFTVAVNRKFKNADGGYDADFINCVAWRGTAEFVSKYFTKGKQIAVVGSIQTRPYEAEGQKRTATEVNADEVEFVGAKADTSEVKQQPTLDEFQPVQLDESELPF